MSIHESGEMYLESILVLREKQGNVRSIDIVNHTGYSKPSISRAVNLLKKSGHITVDVNGAIALTQSGERIAKKIYERHKVLTSFLCSIGVGEETASADACKIEHVISDETLACIKKTMGN